MEGCRKKRRERAKDGWVGHRLGSGPSSGLVVVLATARLTLFTPSHTSRRKHTPLSPVHISFAALVPWQPSLHENWNSSPCALFSPLTLLLWVWPPPRGAGEGVKSGHTFCCRHAEAGRRVRQRFSTHRFWSRNTNETEAARLHSCPFILWTVISYLPEKSLESLFLGSDQDHTWWAVPMHDRAPPQSGVMVSADLQPYQNGSDGLVSILMAPVDPKSCNFPQLRRPWLYILLSCWVQQNGHTHMHT